MSVQPISLREATRHPNPGGERPVERIDDVLDALRCYWHANPDLRLGQIVSNLATRDVDLFVVEDTFLLGRLQELVAGRVRYVVRTAQRGARRVHVWRDEPSDIEPTYAYVSTALCGGVDRQVLPHQLPPTPDPFAVPLREEQVTCDRCWSAYARLLPEETG